MENEILAPGTIIRNEYGKYIAVHDDWFAVLQDDVVEQGTLVHINYFYHFGRKCFDFNIETGPVYDEDTA